jgi:CheY-like chemotaxis protein
MAGERIMIIDDNKEFLEELKEILYLSGYDTLPISNSAIVLSVAIGFKPDIILLDLKMENMNGFDVAEQLKQYPPTKDIPIIAMSGYFPIESKPGILDLSDMRLCIQKPFSVTELITKIEEMLKEKEAQSV